MSKTRSEIEMAGESAIDRQGMFSLKIVGGYRPNVRKLSS